MMIVDNNVKFGAKVVDALRSAYRWGRIPLSIALIAISGYKYLNEDVMAFLSMGIFCAMKLAADIFCTRWFRAPLNAMLGAAILLMAAFVYVEFGVGSVTIAIMLILLVAQVLFMWSEFGVEIARLARR